MGTESGAGDGAGGWEGRLGGRSSESLRPFSGSRVCNSESQLAISLAFLFPYFECLFIWFVGSQLPLRIFAAPHGSFAPALWIEVCWLNCPEACGNSVPDQGLSLHPALQVDSQPLDTGRPPFRAASVCAPDAA